jgi:hypothetical protein
MAGKQEYPICSGRFLPEYPISNKECPIMKEEGTGHKLVLRKGCGCVAALVFVTTNSEIEGSAPGC